MKLVINTKEKGSPLGDMFGIFFEDLNHAADGGLYAELIRNRSFEFDDFDYKDYHALTAWERIGDTKDLSIEILTQNPLNERNTQYLSLNLSSLDMKAGIMNLGYNTGIPLLAGEKYKLSFYGRTEIEKGIPVNFSLRSKSGELFGSINFNVKGQWDKYEYVFKSPKSVNNARLFIVPMDLGQVDLDMISLFPQNTFAGRENGLRKDLAQLLADMKPKFMRFPGGCLVHDGVLEKYNR